MDLDEKHQNEPSSDHEADVDIWTKYAEGRNPMMHNGAMTSRRLKDMRPKLFCKKEKMHVDILDVARPTDTTNAKIFQQEVKDLRSLEDYLSGHNDQHTRFIFICAPSSIKPLKITDQAMKTILTHHDVGPQFLELLQSFATGGKEAEAGPGSLITRTYPDGSCEMQYRISYVEEVIGPSTSSWALRQTGVYHRHGPNGSGNLWIFLHPRPNSTIQTRLENCVKSWDQTEGLHEDLELVNLLVLSSYFGDWRWYLKGLSAEIERIASIAFSIDFSGEGYYERGTDTLQSLHNLQDKVLPLSAKLQSTLKTVAGLGKCNDAFNNNDHANSKSSQMILDELRAYETSIDGHLASVALLEKRVQEILNWLGVALNLKSQATAVKINHNIWGLTKDTVDDSATVRLVTIVTLIYLPASFVASFLGMNLFSFQTAEGTGFQISKSFWIFIVITLPLTFVTVGSWIIMARRHKKRKSFDRKMQALAGGGDEHV